MSQIGLGEYLKKAFGWKWRVPLLGPMPLNAIGVGAFVVAGIANPGFWLLGAALEVAYVMGLASNRRFQKLVEGERLMEQKGTFEQKMYRNFNRLSAPSRGRYQRLYESCTRILGITETLQEEDLAGMRGVRSGGLTQLLAIFLRLLTSRELIGETVSRIDRVKLEKEAAEIEERLNKEAPESPLRRALQGTFDIQKKRLENFHRAEQSRILIDAELERIEQHVVLIGEEAATTGNAEDFSSRLDSVTSALSETNRWLEQNAAIFGSIDSDPVLGSGSTELPSLPAALPSAMAEGPPMPPPPPPHKTRMR